MNKGNEGNGGDEKIGMVIEDLAPAHSCISKNFWDPQYSFITRGALKSWENASELYTRNPEPLQQVPQFLKEKSSSYQHIMKISLVTKGLHRIKRNCQQQKINLGAHTPSQHRLGEIWRTSGVSSRPVFIAIGETCGTKPFKIASE